MDFNGSYDIPQGSVCSDAAYILACEKYGDNPTYDQVNECEDEIEQAAEDHYFDN